MDKLFFNILYLKKHHYSFLIYNIFVAQTPKNFHKLSIIEISFI